RSSVSLIHVQPRKQARSSVHPQLRQVRMTSSSTLMPAAARSSAMAVTRSRRSCGAIDGTVMPTVTGS
ncbi:unnamed protein product, partial [Penicillium discolor]